MEPVIDESEVNGRIVKKFQVIEVPYHLKEARDEDHRPLQSPSFQDVEGMTLEKIKTEIEQVSYKKGYEQARRDIQFSESGVSISGVAFQLGELKKQLCSFIASAEEAGFVSKDLLANVLRDDGSLCSSKQVRVSKPKIKNKRRKVLAWSSQEIISNSSVKK